MHDVGEEVRNDGFDDNVNVVWHHTPCEDAIALSVKMKQGVLDDGGDTRVAQMAGSVSGILVGKDASMKFGLDVLLKRGDLRCRRGDVCG